MLEQYTLCRLSTVQAKYKTSANFYSPSSFIYIFFLLSWSFLEVTTSSHYNDSIQAYAAGAVEAAVTSQVSFILQTCVRIFFPSGITFELIWWLFVLAYL